MIIGITGASGQLGRRTADQLLERVAPSSLVVVTRDPAALADYVARGVTVREGDFDRPASLPEAFAGIDRLLLISASDLGRRVPQHVAAIEAAKAAGVSHIVYTSIVNPSPDNPSVAAQEHYATEEALRASGLRWTMLRNSIYADIQTRFMLDAMPSGQYVHNYGDGLTAFVAREDCAAVAAAVLSTDGHESQAYDVTGRQPLTPAETATILANVAGKELRAVSVDDDTYVSALVARAHLPEPVATALATFGMSVRAGHTDVVSDVIERLTGRPPLPFRAVVEAALPVAA